MSQSFDILGFFWGLISNLLKPLVDFILGFLPNGDPQVYAIIDGIGQVGGASTFNVFYFCDWSAVLICFGVLVTVILIIHVLKLILRSLDMADRAVEKIPFIE